MYIYSRLGRQGALGNQLWEIAGTVGKAMSEGDAYQFPHWEYSDYFSVPPDRFVPHPEGIDLAPAYLQDLNCWKGFEFEIFKLFSPSFLGDELVKSMNLPQGPHTTAVHVRRGNNLNLEEFHPVCELGYFEEAMDSFPSSQLVVFSDDIRWCKKQSLFKDAAFSDGNPPETNLYDLTGPTPLSLPSVVGDLLAMSQCSQFVISNSSFSFWGAMLSQTNDVRYPDPWYGPALASLDVSCMFPDKWTAIKR